MTSSWRTDPVQNGWSVELFWPRWETGALQFCGVEGTAPATEDGKTYRFDVRLNEPRSGSSGVDSFRSIFAATAEVRSGQFSGTSKVTLDDGRATVFEGPQRRYRIVACELGPETFGFRNTIGPDIVVGEGVTTVHVGGV